MTTEHEDTAPEVIRQPARGEPIKLARPPIDWGNEEPDEVWEELYNRGLVKPPYKGRTSIAELVAEWEPIGLELTDEERMCMLGRCRCSNSE